MTKFYSDARDAKTAKQQLEESLRRLKTDVIDLWQVHQIHKAGHPAAVYENDLPEVMLKAREEGKIRYIGFTGHSRPEYLQGMIDRGFNAVWCESEIMPKGGNLNDKKFIHYQLPRILRPVRLLAGHSAYTNPALANAVGAPARINAT